MPTINVTTDELIALRDALTTSRIAATRFARVTTDTDEHDWWQRRAMLLRGIETRLDRDDPQVPPGIDTVNDLLDYLEARGDHPAGESTP